MQSNSSERTLRGAVVGYGGAFNMGKAHTAWMNAVPGLQCVAVCDLDPARTAAAHQDFPGVEITNDVRDLLKRTDIDLVTVVTPHNTHAPLAVQILNAGKHCITEKPMCITVDEATAMIDAARKNKVMVSTFHNRRWDGDFLALEEAILQKQAIGPVFHVEMYGGGYGHPGHWWRGNKEVSGGAFYDWGAHFLYWILRLVPGNMRSVTGYFHKRVWHDVTNEDQVEATIRFESGAVANIQMSSISKVGKPQWRILGEKGGIVSAGDHFTLNGSVDGYSAEARIPHKKSDWEAYYRNVADHLLRGAPLEITPESARRVIAVMDTAEKSAKAGRELPVPFE